MLFIANRVAPAFRFCLANSTLTQAIPIRYPFFLFVTHHCSTYTTIALHPWISLAFFHSLCYNEEYAGMVELADTLDLGSNGFAVQVQVLLPAPYYGVTLIAVRRENSLRFIGGCSLFEPAFTSLTDFFNLQSHFFSGVDGILFFRRFSEIMLT